jgi:imidazolonepropionase-like amidohydrolase
LDWRFDGLTALVSLAAGKAADLVVLADNRAKNIEDVERVETVFKDGVGLFTGRGGHIDPQ